MLHSHRRPTLLALAPLTAVVTAAAVLSPVWTPPGPGSSAVAAPLPTARPTVEEVARTVEHLDHQAEVAAERFNATRERIKSLAVRTAASRTRVAASRREVAAARRVLGMIAAETYKAGGLTALRVFLDGDPDTALAQAGTTATLAQRRADAVARLAAEQARLDRDAADLAAQARLVSDTRAAAGAARADVLAQLAAAQGQLARLRAAQRAQLERASRSGARRSLTQVLGRDVPDRPTCAQAGILPGAGRVGKVIAYLCAHVGDPYVWAAAGPDSFDCSGLSQQAWKQAGVSLPHNAAMQSRLGRRVGAADLQPGDLVFFNNPISHMGIAVGGGLMIAAPRTGDFVKVQPIGFGNFVGAVRL